MSISPCSSACCYSLSLWEWSTDACVQYNHLKETLLPLLSSSSNLFMVAIKSLSEQWPLPLNWIHCQAHCSLVLLSLVRGSLECHHTNVFPSSSSAHSPRVSSQGLLLESLSSTLLIIQEDSLLSYVLYFKQSTAWQLLQHLGNLQPQF